MSRKENIVCHPECCGGFRNKYADENVSGIMGPFPRTAQDDFLETYEGFYLMNKYACRIAAYQNVNFDKMLIREA